MKKIIVCPDSFKECMSAPQVTKIISESLKQRLPGIEVVEIPLADGGEGTSDALMDVYPLYLSVMAEDPLGRTRKAHYYTDITGKKGLIEIADIIGLPLLGPDERNPLKASSFGVGQVILDAANHGFSEVTVALGGSATCDAGMGMLEALGFKFFDSEGNILKGNGENLLKISKIDDKGLNPSLKKLKIRVLTDVNNPLTGQEGAVKIFAPQKGADSKDVELLERGMENLINLVRSHLNLSSEISEAENFPGAGAAGGLGYAFISFLNILPESGIQFVLQELNFAEQIKDADLIITGEGKVERQSLMGKVLSGVIEKARPLNIPVISISGKAQDIPLLLKEGVAAVYSLSGLENENQKDCLSPQKTASKLNEIISKIPLLN